VEVGLQPVQQLGEEGPLGADLQGPSVGGRRGRFDRRWLRRSRTPRCVGRKRGVQSNALGRSRGGFSTKLHAVVDTKGRPIYIAITPGQRHEMIKADELLANAPGKAFIADAGYDSNPIPAGHPRQEEAGRHRLQARANAQAAEVSRAVQQALSRRVLLPQLEALPRHRHALREDSAELPRTHPSRMRVAMACGKLGTPPSR
jgi:transposase